MQASRNVRALALMIGAAVVAACGGSGATAEPTPPPVATTPPLTTAPNPTDPGFPTFALPSFVGDAELEAMLPAEIGGQKLTVISMNGSEFLGAGGGTNAEMQAMLDALDKQPSDLSVAFGGTQTVTIIAFRVKGAPANQLLPALMTAYEAETDATPKQVTLGGKTVTQFTPTAAGDPVSYVYTAGDTVFVVGGMGEVSAAILNEAFSTLP